MINDSVGIIKINRFSATTFDEFNSSIENLLSKKMSHLVLDLRGNPGGYLDASINTLPPLEEGYLFSKT